MNKTRFGSGVGRLAFALMLLDCSLSALADGYVTLTAKNNYNTGFAGAAWSETVEDPSTRDYLAAGGYMFYTMSAEIVNAKSLTLGIVGGTECDYYTYYSATFQNNGIIFANGQARLNATAPTLSGNATFVSPASAPFRFFGTNKNDNRGFVFSGDVHSAATAGILVYANTHTDFYFTFSGDTSDYLGSVVVTSNYDTAGAPLRAEFRLSGSASNFGGSITIRDGAKFHPTITTSVKSLALESGATLLMDAGNTLAVGSLAIEGGATLSLVAGKTLAIITSMTVNGGPVPVALSGAPSSEVKEVTRYALITMPADSACTEADFFVPNYGSNFRTAPHLYMEVSGETKTLYAAYYPTVTLTERNNAGIGDITTGSAITNGAYWSDGEPVHDFAHYAVSRLSGTTEILTPYAPEETMVFPGRSLRFGEYTQIAIRTGDYTISNLYFNCGSNGTSVFGLNGDDVTLRGKFSVNANGIVSFGPRQDGSIRMAGPISGQESSLLNICGSGAGTSLCRGIVILEGDNSAYAGKMTVTLDSPGKLRFADRFMSLRVSDAVSLGGARSEFAYDALKIEHGGRLEAYDSFTMEEPTRGVFISGQGRFYVEPGKTLAIKEQLTVNGRVYKEGSGTLALGGALRFLDSEGAVTSTPPADATNRTFYVTGGRVKLLSAYALDGLDVVFSNKTSKLDVGLAMDVAPADATLLAKGICNTASPAPFAWQSAEASPNITIRLDCDDATPQPSYEFAVMTLSSDVADSVFDSVKLIKPAGFKGYGVKTRRTYDAVANTATLHATLAPCGLLLLVH